MVPRRPCLCRHRLSAYITMGQGSKESVKLPVGAQVKAAKLTTIFMSTRYGRPASTVPTLSTEALIYCAARGQGHPAVFFLAWLTGVSGEQRRRCRGQRYVLLCPSASPLPSSRLGNPFLITWALFRVFLLFLRHHNHHHPLLL